MPQRPATEERLPSLYSPFMRLAFQRDKPTPDAPIDFVPGSPREAVERGAACADLLLQQLKAKAVRQHEELAATSAEIDKARVSLTLFHEWLRNNP